MLTPFSLLLGFFTIPLVIMGVLAPITSAIALLMYDLTFLNQLTNSRLPKKLIALVIMISRMLLFVLSLRAPVKPVIMLGFVALAGELVMVALTIGRASNIHDLGKYVRHFLISWLILFVLHLPTMYVSENWSG